MRTLHRQVVGAVSPGCSKAAGSGFRVWGLGFRVWGLGFKGFGVSGLGLGVWVFGWGLELLRIERHTDTVNIFISPKQASGFCADAACTHDIYICVCIYLPCEPHGINAIAQSAATCLFPMPHALRSKTRNIAEPHKLCIPSAVNTKTL